LRRTKSWMHAAPHSLRSPRGETSTSYTGLTKRVNYFVPQRFEMDTR
jgi:hypothetical protein